MMDLLHIKQGREEAFFNPLLVAYIRGDPNREDTLIYGPNGQLLARVKINVRKVAHWLQQSINGGQALRLHKND